jgi:ABC-2 type transport system ATP-binding protein
MLVRAVQQRDSRSVDENVISIRDLRKQYPGTSRPAVDGVDLDVRRGEVVALLGPNGAGKTTTVEILEGYRDRDAGKVSVLGADPGRAGPAWRARLGIVLQATADVAELRPAEVVHHLASYYPDPRDPDEVLRLVGLWEQRRTLARDLSGGQRRRLDVALGIVGRPDLLFLDEPTTGFDPQARRGFWGLVRTLAAEGTTILLTTHYLDEAEALADRLAVIADGRIVAAGTPATLGGRDTYRATVRWLDRGVPREEHTHSPTALVAELAAECGGEVPALVVARPTLEDVYLDLISAGDAR